MDYKEVLGDLTTRIANSRGDAAESVNRELVVPYWQIGSTIVRQQETGTWGDGIVAQFATDLRSAFPEMKGFKKENLFRMRRFVISWWEIDRWLDKDFPQRIAGTGVTNRVADSDVVGRASPQALSRTGTRIVGTVSPLFQSPQLTRCVTSLSWSHHHTIIARGDRPAERYFDMPMAARDRCSVRELRRPIDSAFFNRYVSVPQQPKKGVSGHANRWKLNRAS